MKKINRKMIFGTAIVTASMGLMACSFSPESNLTPTVYGPPDAMISTDESVYSIPEGTYEVYGRYLKAENGTVFIINWTYVHADKYNNPIVIKNADDYDFEGVSNGDLLTVYVKSVEETWPAAAEIFGYTVDSEGTLDDIDQELLEQLKESGYKIDIEE